MNETSGEKIDDLSFYFWIYIQFFGNVGEKHTICFQSDSSE